MAAGIWLGGASAARAELVWEPVGPVPRSAGMTAVASDPGDARIVWIASSSSVWVSDDAGDSFTLVLQLSRSTGIERETGQGEQVEADPVTATDPGAPDPTDDNGGDPVNPETGETYDPNDPAAVDAAVEASSDIDPTTGLPIDISGGDTTTGDDNAGDDGGSAGGAGDGAADDAISASGDSSARFGVSRLRVLGDKVYVCTGRGLWTIGRAARRVGSGHEVRFGGRRVAVNDALLDAQGRVLVGTERGLLQIGPDGIGRHLAGSDDSVGVGALALVGGRLVIAAADGLRIETAGRIVPLGVGSTRELMTDLLPFGTDRVLVASSGHVTLVVAEAGKAAFAEQSWQVPGAARLAAGRDGAIWAVGRRGAWEYSAEAGWRRRDEGLIDRRLADVAPAASGQSFLYVVGRGGTARLVPEQEKLWTTRAQFQARRALDGLPTAEQAIRWASKARPIQVDDAKSWETASSLAWLLPRVYLRVISTQVRDEDHLFISALGRRVLNGVEVVPIKDEFRIEARWNLMPALLLALEGTDPVVRSAQTSARRSQTKVRDTVGPLYQTWMKKRIDLVATEFRSTRAAVHELLAVQQLEADLHVYTAGHFPIIGVTGDAPAPDATP